MSDTVQVCKVNPVSFMSHLNAGCAISLEGVCWWSPTNVYGLPLIVSVRWRWRGDGEGREGEEIYRIAG